MSDNYYHAGAMDGNNNVVWSDHTRRDRGTAEREARRMAAKREGSRPVIEWWDRRHGLRPRDCELVSGADVLDN